MPTCSTLTCLWLRKHFCRWKKFLCRYLALLRKKKELLPLCQYYKFCLSYLVLSVHQYCFGCTQGCMIWWKTQIAFIVDGIAICNCNNLDPHDRCCGLFSFLFIRMYLLPSIHIHLLCTRCCHVTTHCPCLAALTVPDDIMDRKCPNCSLNK